MKTTKVRSRSRSVKGKKNTTVRTHSRKGTAAYNAKYDIRGGSPDKSHEYASKKSSGVLKEIRNQDEEFGHRKLGSDIATLRRAIKDYSNKGQFPTHTGTGKKKKRK